MKSRFSAYISREYPNVKLFGSWDFDKILLDYKEWCEPSWLYIYFLGNQLNGRSVHAHIGASKYINQRIKQHNGNLLGGPSQTKKAAGHWVPLIYVRIPPFRNYSIRKVKNMYKIGKGWKNKCTNVLNVSKELGFDICVSQGLVIKGHKFYEESIHKQIVQFKNDSSNSFFLQ